mgnify:CR=1 FL=1|tara:strand:+ start:988 stop:1605 length:618 start_codon:yes stop_codon:yes gene_type:complete
MSASTGLRKEKIPYDLDVSHHTNLTHCKFSFFVEKSIRKTIEIASLGWVLLMLLIVINVALRYIFNRGILALEEMQWHIYSAGFMFAIAYAVVTDNHVRVDVLHEKFSTKTQCCIELLGILGFLIPFSYLLFSDSISFVHNSFLVGEISDAPGGLHYRWLLKAVIPISSLVLILASVSRLLKCTSILFGYPKAYISSLERGKNGY